MKRILRHAIAIQLVLLATACTKNADTSYPGYAEGEYVRIAAPYAGSLATLNVKRGERVALNAPLFSLEQESERAAREEAAARVKQAEAKVENLLKGRRPDEVNAVRAQLAQADTALKLSSAELKRTQDLVTSKFLSPARLDEARSAQERDRSRVAELNAQLKVAQLSGRPDEIAAASAEVKAAREQLAQADWRLAQKSQRSPKEALVADTLYTAGEWVQAGMPVVSLLPTENIKLKFFIPEKQLSAVKVGQPVQVSCDGCAPITANVSYIAPQAEYTSPLIYSKDNRATLVFLVEARAKPEDAAKLHPGQPVDVKL
jgi:HlyD family secretion protein